MIWYSFDEKVFVLSLHVQPKAGTDEWCGLCGELAPMSDDADLELSKALRTRLGVAISIY